MNSNLYKRPNKPLFIAVNNRARNFEVKTTDIEIMSVHTSTECHVTPADVAEKMAWYLNLDDSLEVLDPQAGTGNLSAACFAEGYSIHLTAVEINCALSKATSNRLSKYNAEVINRDFLEFALHPRKQFDRIITNPPFSTAKKHIQACLDMLANGGVMVALVPSSFSHPRAEQLENLERNIFALTSVATKLIRFRK